MELRRKSNLIPPLLVAGLLVFGTVVRAATEKGETLLLINDYHSKTGDWFFYNVTQLGDAAPYWIVVAVLLFVRVRYALTAGLLGMTTLVVSGALKMWFGHARPFTWFGDAGLLHLLTPVEHIRLYDAYNSFPSGHSLAAFTLFMFLALIVHKKWIAIASISLATLVGLSRIYLHLHFLEDVLFGAFCGSVLAILGYYLQEKYLASKEGWNKSLMELVRKKEA